jgi:hypothetical protein
MRKKTTQLDFIDANKIRSQKAKEEKRKQQAHLVENMERLIETGTLDGIDWEIYHTLREHGSMTTLEIATHNGVQRDSYSPRMQDLVKDEAIRKGPKRIDRISGYKATSWIANLGWTQK